MPAPAVTYQQCRALGHSWKHLGRAERRDSGDRVGVMSRCSNCKTTRTKWIGRQGQLLGSVYDYPDGYSLHGEERLPNHEWRSLLVHSLFPND